MTERTPEEAGDTTDQGRAIGPERRNQRWQAWFRVLSFLVRRQILYGRTQTAGYNGSRYPETPVFALLPRVTSGVTVGNFVTPDNSVRSNSKVPPAVPRVYADKHDGGSGIPVSEAGGREYGVSCATDGFPEGDLGQCALVRCARAAARPVEHPYRPEGSTLLCEEHAREASRIDREASQ